MQRRGRHEPLADAQVVIVAGRPRLALRLALPGPRRQVAGRLQRQLNALDATKAELPAVDVDAIHRQPLNKLVVLIEAAGDLIEVDVARVGNTQAHVHQPVAGQIPADERLHPTGVVGSEAVGNLNGAGVEQKTVGGDDALLHPSGRRDQLES